jgi:large subunit ribosomal protein L20
MARIKRAQLKKVATRKLFKRAKGFFLSRGKLRRQAHQAVMHAQRDAYIGRKQKKRQYRALWITRLSAALKVHGISYSKFMHGVHTAGVALDRKQLSELAIHDAAAFTAVVEKARAAIA